MEVVGRREPEPRHDPAECSGGRAVPRGSSERGAAARWKEWLWTGQTKSMPPRIADEGPLILGRVDSETTERLFAIGKSFHTSPGHPPSTGVFSFPRWVGPKRSARGGLRYGAGP